MKFATAKEHRDFFQKNGWIEFEDFISNEQLILINQSINQVLSDRLKVTPQRLRTISSENIYMQGRDLWRSNSPLQKFISQPRFGEIVSELVEKKVFRLGYDQLLPARYQVQFSESTSKIYTKFLEQSLTLEAVSCLQGVTCGIMFALGEIENQESTNEMPASGSGDNSEGINVFPSKPGRVIFFQPNVNINWHELYSNPGQSFYLIVYTQATAHYQLQPQDPHTHDLKRLGYIFNDKLSDKLHPIVYR